MDSLDGCFGSHSHTNSRGIGGVWQGLFLSLCPLKLTISSSASISSSVVIAVGANGDDGLAIVPIVEDAITVVEVFGVAEVDALHEFDGAAAGITVPDAKG